MSENNVRVQIVPMAAAHLDALAAIERECFAHPWSREALAEELTNPAAVFRTALADGAVAGYVGMHAVLGEGYVDNLAVGGQYRRAGVGTALMRALLDYAEAHRFRFVTLEVRESNASAIRLYEKMGFTDVGRRPGFYTDPREDARLMTWDRV